MTLSTKAMEDLTWWCMLLAVPPSRPLRLAAGRVFLWHQRNPDIDELRKIAWAEGLVVVLATDASGDIGWGVSCQDVWRQGYWAAEEAHRSINWKKLKAYHYALLRFDDLLKGKLIYIRMDNACSVHYVNAGSGRIPELCDLAKSIRIEELHLGVERVAVYLPGEQNVTADALSRMQVDAAKRDKHGERSLHKKIFQQLQVRIPSISMDGRASDDGRNSQLERYRCPSDSVFEVDFTNEVVWLFPPDELIAPVLKFLQALRRQDKPHQVVLCVPERPSAGWFYHLKQYARVFRFVRGSDLFREQAPTGLWKQLPPVREAWLIVASPSLV